MNKVAILTFLSVLVSTASLSRPITGGRDEQLAVEPIPRAEMVDYLTEQYMQKQKQEEVEEIDIPDDIFIYYDIPLEYELQQYVVQLCREKNIDAELVFAIIEKESTYNADLLGDNGRSVGLMQIQPRWHQAEMKKLGCTDLSDPYQNVRVGVEILSELINKYQSIDYALMCYNGGESYAEKLKTQGINSTTYTRDVNNLRYQIHGKQYCYD